MSQVYISSDPARFVDRLNNPRAGGWRKRWRHPRRAPARHSRLVGGVKMGWCGASIRRARLRQGWVVLGAGRPTPDFPRQSQVRIPPPSPRLSSHLLFPLFSSPLLCSALRCSGYAQTKCRPWNASQQPRGVNPPQDRRGETDLAKNSWRRSVL